LFVGVEGMSDVKINDILRGENPADTKRNWVAYRVAVLEKFQLHDELKWCVRTHGVNFPEKCKDLAAEYIRAVRPFHPAGNVRFDDEQFAKIAAYKPPQITYHPSVAAHEASL